MLLDLNFWASNNKAEFEALIVGLKLAKAINIYNLLLLSDSQLVVED